MVIDLTNARSKLTDTLIDIIASTLLTNLDSLSSLLTSAYDIGNKHIYEIVYN